MSSIPHEISVGGVYLPPMLVAAMIGLVFTIFTVRMLNRYRISRYFFNPSLVFLALLVVYTIVLGHFLVGM